MHIMNTMRYKYPQNQKFERKNHACVYVYTFPFMCFHTCLYAYVYVDTYSHIDDLLFVDHKDHLRTTENRCLQMVLTEGGLCFNRCGVPCQRFTLGAGRVGSRGRAPACAPLTLGSNDMFKVCAGGCMCECVNV